ncbi:MAG: hypothetical protein FJX59_00075 [Alphaproteobacteria bacterium]|nr:hypothetical protein [Alphaproteobacteria bacterium]
MFRPIIKLLVAKGIGLPALIEVLKGIYISVAQEEFPTNGRRTTDSRISLLTGVHRKDVKRLREDADESFVAPRSIGIGAMVIGRWLGSARTTDLQGAPLPLPRHADQPGGPSFDALVESVSTDVRPRAVLDEWLALGIARLDEKGRVVLNRAAFVPEKGLDEKAFYLGRNVHDHLAASVHNVLGGGNPMLERSVHYSGLTDESVKTIAETAERLGMQALLSINRLALELADKDKSTTDKSSLAGAKRVNFGLYLFHGAATLNGEAKDDSAK